ncbi:two-component system, sensor histidine kinase YesM [Gracilibacillus ureilyticus]|uniref:Two-component system, sensor histidine kinase YesM n=1 Tax=Gracilibacillus ureilyticus TaxID=531814 RepID=A0A1H9PRD7_9BACI|nr:sensor histidine kinase [Gracilibacillus ureilyticus]SER50668.1 two-component system, sensor histidine kinase YesM [Gracilibacillus ureilyticus]
MKILHFNDIRIRNKFLLIYMFSVFLPIILTNIIFYIVTTENVRDQKIKDYELALEQIATGFRQGVEDAAGIASVLYSDAYIYQLLNKSYETPVEFISAYINNFRDINKYTPIYSSVDSIHLYTDNPTVITAGGIYSINQEMRKSYWYQTTSQSRLSYPVLTRNISETGELDQFVIVRELDSNHSALYEKIMMINLNDRFIKQSFTNKTFEGEVYLVDNLGIVQYSTDPSVDPAKSITRFESINMNEDSVIMEETYQLQYLDNWKLIGVIPNENLITEVQNSIYSIIYLASWNFVIPTLFILYIAGNIHLRLSTIVKQMRKVKDQRFEIIEGKMYRDEIGVLTSEFNRMTRKIKDLINDVYIVRIQKQELELEKKDAQLKALQSQINPHFLFNVLETIRMRSVLKNEMETADIIKYLAQLLRTSISWEDEWVTIGKEIQLIYAFLEIQKYRFDDKMAYEINVEDGLEQCYIPKMTIIPFIENASIHGIEPLKGKGKINLRIHKQNNLIKCIIKDNGVGIKKEKYKQILKSLEDEEVIGKNIGIRNVSQRLKMYYGKNYELSITSNELEGTTIILVIPANNHMVM